MPFNAKRVNMFMSAVSSTKPGMMTRSKTKAEAAKLGAPPLYMGQSDTQPSAPPLYMGQSDTQPSAPPLYIGQSSASAANTLPRPSGVVTGSRAPVFVPRPPNKPNPRRTLNTRPANSALYTRPANSALYATPTNPTKPPSAFNQGFSTPERPGFGFPVPRPSHTSFKPVHQNYVEKQNRLLCGKHAMNHILQEEKFVWKPEQTRYINKLTGESLDEDVNPKDSNVQINMWRECKILDEISKQIELELYLIKEHPKIIKRLKEPLPSHTNEYVRQELAKGRTRKQIDAELAYNIKGWTGLQAKFKGKNTEAVREILENEFEYYAGQDASCDFNKKLTTGQFPFIIFDNDHNKIIESLGYRYVIQPVYDNETWKQVMRESIDNPYLIGILINIHLPEHYIAVSKYTSKCSNPGEYVYAESMGGGSLNCLTFDKLISLFEEKGIRNMYYIYADTESPYNSVAVQRMKQRTTGGRKTRKVRKTNKRKSLRQRR